MKVSIVTPSFNQGIYLERTLASVKTQLVNGELEHIVFDGGSCDQSVAILSQQAASIPYLTWISEKDKGQAHAVNKGILASKGEIIGWLNSDDVYYHGAIAAILTVFNENPDVDVVYGMADHIDQNDVFIEEYPTENWDAKRLMDTCYICQPALFLRKKVIEQNGLLDANLQYCMDYEYWLRLSANGVKFFYLPQKLAGSRLYNETKTMSARTEVRYEICQMLKKKYNTVPAKWVIKHAFSVIEKKINKKHCPKLFYLYLLFYSFYGTLKWNKTISKQYLMLILQRFIRHFAPQ